MEKKEVGALEPKEDEEVSKMPEEEGEGEEEEEEESVVSKPPVAKPAEPQRPQIDRRQLEVARNELSLLFDKLNSGKDRHYTSSNCIIKSIFEHTLDEVNKTKVSRLSEAKEEVSDNIRELLKSLNLSFDKRINEASYSQIEGSFLKGIVDEQIMQMTPKQLSQLSMKINNEMVTPDIKKYMAYVEDHINKKI
jgi:hypothetical protein